MTTPSVYLPDSRRTLVDLLIISRLFIAYIWKYLNPSPLSQMYKKEDYDFMHSCLHTIVEWNEILNSAKTIFFQIPYKKTIKRLSDAKNRERLFWWMITEYFMCSLGKCKLHKPCMVTDLCHFTNCYLFVKSMQKDDKTIWFNLALFSA